MIPYINDRRANPVFFPNPTLKRLGEVTGDQGAARFSRNSRSSYFLGWMIAWGWILILRKITKS